MGEEPVYEENFWNKKIETLPLEEIRSIQLKKLKKQMKCFYGARVTPVGAEEDIQEGEKPS